VKELGGPDIPGIGFAIGLERLAALIPISQEELAPGPDLFIAPLGDVARVWAFSVCNYLRMLGIRTEMGYGDKSLKSQMKRSNKLKSRTTLILGENEINEGAAELRDMAAGTQEKVSLENFDQLAELIMTKTRER
jgi:histidyl-tRNA synthetase